MVGRGDVERRRYGCARCAVRGLSADYVAVRRSRRELVLCCIIRRLILVEYRGCIRRNCACGNVMRAGAVRHLVWIRLQKDAV